MDKKYSWKDSFQKWLRGDIPEDKIFRNVDPDAGIPLILRIILSSKRNFVIVFPNLISAEKASEFLPLWAESMGVSSFPISLLPETVSDKRVMPENESGLARVLNSALDRKRLGIYTASITAFLSPVPSPEKTRKNIIELKIDSEVKMSKLLASLVEMDYDDEYEVCSPGEFSRRGGILDIFSPACDFPARIEFFGDTIASIRSFSPENQRSTGLISSYTIIGRTAISSENTGFCFHDYFNKEDTDLIIVFPELCRTHLERFGSHAGLMKWDGILKSSGGQAFYRLLDPIESASAKIPKGSDPGCYPSTAHLLKDLNNETLSSAKQLIQQLTAEQVRQWLHSGYQIALIGRNSDSEEYILGWCEDNKINTGSVHIDISPIPYGVMLPEEKLVILTERELYFTAHTRNLPYKIQETIKKTVLSAGDNIPATFADIENGDHIVHSTYGIGIFRGLVEFSKKGCEQELLQLEFADEITVYVPIWQADMISRYVGVKKSAPSLSKIGSQKWLMSRIKAAKSVHGLAEQMLRIQAMRTNSHGFTFPPDDRQQRYFEESFPFQDTPDQRKATLAVKKDMCSTRPMDRLICGDVGYGKTEVAVRAAFKAVNAGKQVAVLVPTTVLAQQHYYTFSERFAEYPVIIEMLSRFRVPKEQKEILGKASEGKIDILIGTHRIIQSDVNFKNLGLVIIDEEQRFGVKDKERLKSLRATVDILTMTATPIPRTLYMTMTGLRDLSTIMTPPDLRLPIQTIVCQFDERIIASAIEKEVQRGGQVYYLHNRVQSIENTFMKLKKLLPDANFAVAHGRIHGDKLERIMSEFLDGKVDVLVCTTIIESGLDIPNANTIIIERADRFGLAELYQLRGRVGRWNRQAYAYFLLPKNVVLENNVRERIAAIKKYTQLGTGFRLALRDLEIRGAGNLLGTEQSGHINAVGFDLYCSLLRNTMAEFQHRSKNILPEIDISLDFIDFAYRSHKGNMPAALPPDYIQSEKLRIDAYRRLSGAANEKELYKLISELEDRYGKLPPQALNMIEFYRFRFRLSEKKITLLSVTGSGMRIKFKSESNRVGEKIFRLKSVTPEKKFQEVLLVIKAF